MGTTFEGSWEVERFRAENERLKAELDKADETLIRAAIREDKLIKELAALRQSQKAGEPVAWARYPRFTGRLTKQEVVFNKPESNDWTPLYTAPQPSQQAGVPDKAAAIVKMVADELPKTIGSLNKELLLSDLMDVAALLFPSQPSQPSEDARDSATKALALFERCVSTLVSDDYAKGYREACNHIDAMQKGGDTQSTKDAK